MAQLHNKKHQRSHSRMSSQMLLHEDPFGSAQMNVFGPMNTMMSRFDNMVNIMFSRGLNPHPSASNRRMQLHTERPSPFRHLDVDFTANYPNCHVYSTSAVMSMATGPDGRAQVYQASSSTKALPGGIRETQKTVCDSRSGVKKMSLGHHIGERGRVIERQKNLWSGEEEERQEFINLDEEEAERFDREFEQYVMRRKPINSATPDRSPKNNPKRHATLTPEVVALSNQRSYKGASHQHTPHLSSGKGKKSVLKATLRKIRK